MVTPNEPVTFELTPGNDDTKGVGLVLTASTMSVLGYCDIDVTVLIEELLSDLTGLAGIRVEAAVAEVEAKGECDMEVVMTLLCWFEFVGVVLAVARGPV